MLANGRAMAAAAAVRLRRPFFSTAPRLGAWNDIIIAYRPGVYLRKPSI